MINFIDKFQKAMSFNFFRRSIAFDSMLLVFVFGGISIASSLVLDKPAFADLIDEELEDDEPHVQEQKPDESVPQVGIENPSTSIDPGSGSKVEQPPVTTSPAPKVTSPPPQKKNTKRSVLAPKKKRKPKKDAKREPVQFESLGARGIREKGEFELVKNVVVTQGGLRMEANHAKVYVDQITNEVIKVVADGKVKLFQEDEETGERLKAFGESMVFNNQKRNVVLSGNARLWRGANLIRGKHITYELDSGWIYADRVEGEVHSNGSKSQKGN